MENENIAVGLDIGTTKIVAMIGKTNEYGKVEILGIGKSKSLGVHRGVVNNITQTIQSIQQAVQDAETSSGIMAMRGILTPEFRLPPTTSRTCQVHGRLGPPLGPREMTSVASAGSD